jgi:hypothetical protein
MPENRVIADVHRRIKKPVTKRATLFHVRYGPIDVVAGGNGSV